MKLVGIDGCKAGWVVARIGGSVDSLAFNTMPNLTAVFEEVRAGELRAIADVPIGLPERGPRVCDRSARALLGSPRRNSVFPAPCRPVLTAGDYREVCELNFRASGRRVTRQLYGILAKIREVDEGMSPALQTNFREAHPEVTFCGAIGRTWSCSFQEGRRRRNRATCDPQEVLPRPRRHRDTCQPGRGERGSRRHH